MAAPKNSALAHRMPPPTTGPVPSWNPCHSTRRVSLYPWDRCTCRPGAAASCNRDIFPDLRMLAWPPHLFLYGSLCGTPGMVPCGHAHEYHQFESRAI